MKKRKVTLTIFGEWKGLFNGRCQLCGAENTFCTQMLSKYVKPINVCMDCFNKCEDA